MLGGDPAAAPINGLGASVNNSTNNRGNGGNEDVAQNDDAQN